MKTDLLRMVRGIQRDYEVPAKPEPTFQHVKYGFCTEHGLGICPSDCKAIAVNDLFESLKDSPTARAVFREPNHR